jgi:hypothetical protein
VGPRTGLDDVERRKFLNLPGLEPRPFGRPARSQSLYRRTASESQATCCNASARQYVTDGRSDWSAVKLFFGMFVERTRTGLHWSSNMLLL